MFAFLKGGTSWQKRDTDFEEENQKHLVTTSLAYLLYVFSLLMGNSDL